MSKSCSITFQTSQLSLDTCGAGCSAANAAAIARLGVQASSKGIWLQSSAAQMVSGDLLIQAHSSAVTTCKQMQAEAQRKLAAALAQLVAGEGQVEAAGPDGAPGPPGLCHAPCLGALALDCQLQGRAAWACL